MIFHSTYKRFISKISKDNIDFLVHSKNYLSAEFINKTVTFLAIPILTRLLTPAEYGIIAVFNSFVSVLSILLILGIRGAIVRYYYENKDDFFTFLKGNLIFQIVIDILLVGLIYIFSEQIIKFFNVNQEVFIYALGVSFCIPAFRLYQSYLRASTKSRAFAVLSIIEGTGLIIISVIWIALKEEHKFFGRIYAHIIIAAILFIIAIYQVNKKAKIQVLSSHIKYALAFGLPLIPHALSGYILTVFDRLIINQLEGAEQTGLYTFAYNVGMIIYFVITAMNRSWQPIFYDKLRKKEYNKLDALANNYARYIFLIATIVIFFSKELIMIMADAKFYDALSIIPYVISGYLFLFFYTLILNYAFYKKKTFLISLATIIVGIINIALNYWLIPIYDYKAAAITTLISYALLFLFHYINVKLFLKIHLLKIRSIPLYIITFLFSLLLIYLISYFQINYIISIIIKIIFSILIIFVFFYHKLIMFFNETNK